MILTKNKNLLSLLNKPGIEYTKIFTHPTESPSPWLQTLEVACCDESFLRLSLKLDQMVRQTEKAERAVKASHNRRAPKPGGAVQRKRNLERKPKKTRPVHLGRQDHPITSPIMTASHMGTAQSKMSTNVSAIHGFFKKSTRSNKGSGSAININFFEKLSSLPPTKRNKKNRSCESEGSYLGVLRIDLHGWWTDINFNTQIIDRETFV